MSKVLNALDNNAVELSGENGTRKIIKIENVPQLFLARRPSDDAYVMVTKPEQSSEPPMTDNSTDVSCMLSPCSNLIQIIPTPLYSTTLATHVVYSTQFTPQIATTVQTSNELVETHIPLQQPVVRVISSSDASDINQSTCTDDRTGGSRMLQMLTECAKSQAEDFVTQLRSIVSSPMSQSTQETLDPKEVMKFYHMLPEEKKVFKTKRTKYRKYSLATEYQMFRRAGMESTSSV